jgi:hypothetical protein
MMTVILVTLGAGLLAGALVAVSLGVGGRGHRHGAGAWGGNSRVRGVRPGGQMSAASSPLVAGSPAGAAAIVTVAGLVLFGVILTMVAAHWGLADYDGGVARWAADHASAGSTDGLRI